MLKEFKEFAMRGKVVDLAIGVIIGAAFGGIVNSLICKEGRPARGVARPHGALLEEIRDALAKN